MARAEKVSAGTESRALPQWCPFTVVTISVQSDRSRILSSHPLPPSFLHLRLLPRSMQPVAAEQGGPIGLCPLPCHRQGRPSDSNSPAAPPHIHARKGHKYGSEEHGAAGHEGDPAVIAAADMAGTRPLQSGRSGAARPCRPSQSPSRARCDAAVPCPSHDHKSATHSHMSITRTMCGCTSGGPGRRPDAKLSSFGFLALGLTVGDCACGRRASCSYAHTGTVSLQADGLSMQSLSARAADT